MSETPIQLVWYGSLTLALRGRDLSACIAALQRRGITLRNVRVRRDYAVVTVSLRAFPMVYQVCRQHRVKFRIEARHGAPFWRRRLWRRKAFAIGAVAFVCAMYAMSSVIWRIDIQGATDEDGVAELRAAAHDAGLYVGQWRSRLADPAVLAEEMLKHANNFVWIGVQTTGSVTTIRAIPKIEGARAAAEQPHNIVAARPAVILNVQATRGRPMVKPNQFVRPGQVLISGVLAEGEPNVPASGKVLGEVWYTSNVTIPLTMIQQGLTGETATRDYLYLGSWRLRVWGFKEPQFAAVYERDEGTDWHIGQFVLPVQWQRATLYEASPSAIIQSVAAAKETALVAAQRDVATQAGGDSRVLGQSVLHERVERGTLYETILTRVEQDIGAPAPIPAPAPESSNSTSQTQG
ncbi:sporulation protein YqfD [Alicyclobacillus hesperidum subsp. aegles]|uniref:sporulation protein YqfD n=1 Tax=Alicyclobacillus hesperidum TaxID=89784 RepID=UPI000719277F|nr:sporulation protein YqfD [Alicyclobacillus hesperidum]GLG00302.1 sporulation protein YqfD [Alicyclobacillus hesperidum subsp. aegles]